MLIATFGPSTGWVGKTIVYEGERFVLEGYGEITAKAVLKYDRQGHLDWAYDGLREWVGEMAASQPGIPPRTAGTKETPAHVSSRPQLKRLPIAADHGHLRRNVLIIVGAGLALVVALIVLTVINGTPQTAQDSTNGLSRLTAIPRAPPAPQVRLSPTLPSALPLTSMCAPISRASTSPRRRSR